MLSIHSYDLYKVTFVVNVMEPYVVYFFPAHSLKAKSNFTELRLQNCGLNANDTALLADVLKNIPSLCVLDLSFTHVSIEGAEHLGNAY